MVAGSDDSTGGGAILNVIGQPNPPGCFKLNPGGFMPVLRREQRVAVAAWVMSGAETGVASVTQFQGSSGFDYGGPGDFFCPVHQGLRGSDRIHREGFGATIRRNRDSRKQSVLNFMFRQVVESVIMTGIQKRTFTGFLSAFLVLPFAFIAGGLTIHAAEALGPQGGSYHRVASAGRNGGSIYSEWILSPQGQLVVYLYRMQGGRAVALDSSMIPDQFEAWISVLGKEGLSAEKTVLRRMQPDPEPASAQAVPASPRNPFRYSASLEDKLVGEDLYAVVPDIRIGDRLARFAGIVRCPDPKVNSPSTANTSAESPAP